MPLDTRDFPQLTNVNEKSAQFARDADGAVINEYGWVESTPANDADTGESTGANTRSDIVKRVRSGEACTQVYCKLGDMADNDVFVLPLMVAEQDPDGHAKNICFYPNSVYEFAVFLTSDPLDGVPPNIHIRPISDEDLVARTTGYPDATGGDPGAVATHGDATTSSWLQDTARKQTFFVHFRSDQRDLSVLNDAAASAPGITIYCRRIR